MTNRQLARWVTAGKGQILYRGTLFTQWNYPLGEDNNEPDSPCLLRDWGALELREAKLEPVQSWEGDF